MIRGTRKGVVYMVIGLKKNKIMKKFIKIMLNDIKQEEFTKDEIIVFSIIVPLLFIVLYILVETF